MSMTRIITAALFALFLTGAAADASAQQSEIKDLDKIIAEIRPYKHNFFISELKLSKDQAREFLALYDKMESELLTINEDTRELERSVNDDPSASDTETEAAARATFEQKQREAQVELLYYDKFKEILTQRQLLQLKSTEKRFTQKLARSHRKLRREKNEK